MPAQTTWVPHSMIHRQAAAAVGKLLAADESRSSGVTVKGLTMAAHVVEKKATYAVTCNTLRCASHPFPSSTEAPSGCIRLHIMRRVMMHKTIRNGPTQEVTI